MLDDNVIDRLGDLLKELDATRLSTPVRLGVEATLLLRQAGVGWEEFSLLLRLGWESYRTGCPRMLDWAFDPARWRALSPTPDGRRRFDYHEFARNPAIARIEECHPASPDPASVTCWSALVANHPVVHRATGRHCIPGRVATAQIVGQLAAWQGNPNTPDDALLEYHGYLLDEGVVLDPDEAGALAQLLHPTLANG
jgi:hypothetical protein